MADSISLLIIIPKKPPEGNVHSGKQLCGRCILFDIIPPKEAGPGRID